MDFRDVDIAALVRFICEVAGKIFILDEQICIRAILR